MARSISSEEERMTHKAVGTLVVLIVGTLALSARPAQAQNGPYYATPSWDQTLACSTTTNCPRFIVVMGGAAVLDRETGLVWEQHPDSMVHKWEVAVESCAQKEVGGRSGWRLPTLQEMLSLTAVGQLLPAGHPFTVTFLNGTAPTFWTATQFVLTTDYAWVVELMVGSFNGIALKSTPAFTAWCVRGGTGNPAQ
jgi:hypothetical protein